MLTTITGCQGKNGGGWAHYVGQEKVRPITGHQQLAMSVDWQRPPRQMIGTAYWYLATGQYRYDHFDAASFAAPTGTGRFEGMTTADVLAQSARLGWMPSFPTFNWNPLDLGDAITSSGQKPGDFVADELESGRLRFAGEDPDAPENFPRVLTVWRANLLGSSGKGNEYFLKHLLGADDSLRATEAPTGRRPRDLTWRDEAPEGKLDLLLALDFRMTSTTIFADVVLPAATWYEKHDLNTTDMHPFVNAFTPAISPPWQTRTDFDIFATLAKTFSEQARAHLGVRTDLVASPLAHDTADEMALPHGQVRTGAPDGTRPVPGVNFPKLTLVERDYGAVYDKWRALGPLLDSLGATTKGITFDLTQPVEYLRHKNGTVRGGPGAGRPSLARDVDWCEAILAMSGTTNGHLAVQGFETMEKRTGPGWPTWPGSTRASRSPSPTPSPDRRRSSPRRSGAAASTAAALQPVRHQRRAVQALAHPHRPAALLRRARLDGRARRAAPGLPAAAGHDVDVRRAAPRRAGRARHHGPVPHPHNKWSIHSEYQDNLFMLSLSRGGPLIWVSDLDAAKVGVSDNDWIEAVNRNGVVVARAIVSSRMPQGTVYMHHAQDRLIDVPIAETSGKRGGIHNSITRLLMKPTHLAGGYAQLSYAFNYLGPTGNQRDEVTTIRRRNQEVTY
jgi:nitrate reductase alpha subunit